MQFIDFSCQICFSSSRVVAKSFCHSISFLGMFDVIEYRNQEVIMLLSSATGFGSSVSGSALLLKNPFLVYRPLL
jgi:hypothetical protein